MNHSSTIGVIKAYDGSIDSGQKANGKGMKLHCEGSDIESTYLEALEYPQTIIMILDILFNRVLILCHACLSQNLAGRVSDTSSPIMNPGWDPGRPFSIGGNEQTTGYVPSPGRNSSVASSAKQGVFCATWHLRFKSGILIRWLPMISAVSTPATSRVCACARCTSVGSHKVQPSATSERDTDKVG